MSRPANATQPPPRKTMIKDPVDPQVVQEDRFIYCCEQCSYFVASKTACSIGYHCKPHLKANQIKTYYLTGKMTFCRFLEID